MDTQNSTKELIHRIVRTGLVGKRQLDEVAARLGARLKREVTSDELIAELVRLDRLTPWQAQQIQAGQIQGFYLGQYKLLAELGAGGMGRVYLAEHVLMCRRVAIKTLNSTNDARRLSRFMTESCASAQLDHPNIVRVYHLDRDTNGFYLVMEYVPGENLQDLVARKGPLPADQAADAIRQAAKALAHLHRQKLVHRDVKPSNLLLDPSGAVKLLDLGLVRTEDSENAQVTSENSLLGSVDYVAPEQVLSSHHVDERADIYSLGGTFYYLLTGQTPFDDKEMLARLYKRFSVDPKPVRVHQPNCPAALADLCRRMLARATEDRVASADQIVTEIEAWQAKCRRAAVEDVSQPLAAVELLPENSQDEASQTVSYTIAHRLNNLLQCIVGESDLALEQTAVNSAVSCHLQQIKLAADRARQFSQDLIICSNKLKSRLARVDLAAALRHFEPELRRLLPEGRELKINVPRAPVHIQANLDQLKRMLECLVANAADASVGPAGVVQINAVLKPAGEFAPEASLQMEVIDDGEGIAPADLPRVFEMFFSTRSPDRGMGLAVVSAIADNHQGVVSIKSDAGSGTTVRVSLPVTGSLEQEPRRPLILVADDNDHVRGFTGRALTQRGYEVILASDGNQALELFQERAETIDLVLLDIMMPGAFGDDAARQMKSIRPDLPILFISGSAESTRLDDLLAKRSAAFMQKPYHFNELADKIELLLDQPGRSAAATRS